MNSGICLKMHLKSNNCEQTIRNKNYSSNEQMLFYVAFVFKLLFER